MKKLILLLTLIFVMLTSQGQTLSDTLTLCGMNEYGNPNLKRVDNCLRLWGATFSFEDDFSIKIGVIEFKAEELPKLFEIFEIGQKLCKFNSTTKEDVPFEKLIGNFDDVKIYYGYYPETAIKGSLFGTEKYCIKIYGELTKEIELFPSLSLVDSIIKARDKYYSEVRECAKKILAVNKKMDDIINNIN